MGPTDIIDLVGPAEHIVLLAAVVTSLGLLWRYLVRPAWRGVRWLRAEIRDEVAQRKVLSAIVQRELNYNGGSSMKDFALHAKQEMEGLRSEVTRLADANHGIAVVLDNLVTRKEFEHDEIWAALVTLGVDRRRPERNPE